MELGIGSRVRHPEFGAGVIINVKARTYLIVFIEKGKVVEQDTYENLSFKAFEKIGELLISFTQKLN